MRSQAKHRIRPRLVGAIALTSWVVASLFLTVAPVLALSATCGAVTLTNGGVSPASGTQATTFTFSVTYTNSNGGSPSRARVRFQDLSQVTLTGSGNTTAGVVYTGSTTKANGTWTYTFRFRTNGVWCETPSGTFVVAPATPPPTAKPTPTPTPKPTPTPTPSPKATPKPTPKPSPKATPKPTPKPLTTPKPRAKPSGKPKPTARTAASPTATAGRPSPSDGPSDSGLATPAPSPTSSPSPGGLGAIVRGSTGGPPQDGRSLDLAGLPGAIGGVFMNPLVVWLLTAAGGTALYLGLVRRARDDDGRGGELALATATLAPGITGTKGRGPKGTISADAAQNGPAAAVATGPLTFDAPPGKGVERAMIAYHKVRISSKPDALRSVELGRLDRGDEVEIVDSYEGFLQVRTPDDIVGWILRHTIVGAPK